MEIEFLFLFYTCYFCAVLGILSSCLSILESCLMMTSIDFLFCSEAFSTLGVLSTPFLLGSEYYNAKSFQIILFKQLLLTFKINIISIHRKKVQNSNEVMISDFAKIK